MVTSTVARTMPTVGGHSEEREQWQDTSLYICTVRLRDTALVTTALTVSSAGTILLAVVGGATDLAKRPQSRFRLFLSNPCVFVCVLLGYLAVHVASRVRLSLGISGS